MSQKNFSGEMVKLVKIDKEDYVSLNQIAQSGNFSEPSERIKRWLRSNATIKYLAEWEYLHNSDFNSVGFNRIKDELFEDSFVVTPTRREVIDAMLIQWDVEELKERQKILKDTYDFIYPILKRSKTIQELQAMADKANQ